MARMCGASSIDVVGGHGGNNKQEDDFDIILVIFSLDQQKYVQELDQKASSLNNHKASKNGEDFSTSNSTIHSKLHDHLWPYATLPLASHHHQLFPYIFACEF